MWPDWPFEFRTSARVDSQMPPGKVLVMVDTPSFLHSEAELTFGEAHGTLRTYRELAEEALGNLSVTLTAEEKAAFQARVRGDDPRLGKAMVEIHELIRGKAVAATVQYAHRSFILAVASATEEQARVFCDALQVPKGVAKRCKDLPGTNTLDRLAEYAFELAGLPRPPDTLWSAARSLEQIRHCIAHANGQVTGSRHEENLRAIARGGKVPGFAIDDEGRIVLDEACGRHTIDVFSHLFYHLYEHAKLPGIPVTT